MFNKRSPVTFFMLSFSLSAIVRIRKFDLLIEESLPMSCVSRSLGSDDTFKWSIWTSALLSLSRRKRNGRRMLTVYTYTYREVAH